MRLNEFRNINEFLEYSSSTRNERILVESRIQQEKKKFKKWNLIGFCELCQKDSRFEFDTKNINFRESLKCEHCKLINRWRFVLSYLKKILKNTNSNTSVFMYEQVTPLFKYAENFFKNINLIGSEFLGYDKKPGEIIRNIRHENSMELSFNDNSFDIIVSTDVFEHVPDIQKTLTEAYRVLKENGTLLISVPLDVNKQETIQRAVFDNGKIKSLLPEVYHGNPMSSKGSLVFYDYGWDFLNFLRKAGFKEVYCLDYFSIFYGYLGNGFQFIIVAKK